MPTNDDFFSLAELEKPQMMPTPPVGAGALAGWMYGSDKARQDQALQGATGLAQLRAMMEQQKDSETMAGAPGRMAGIQYDNGMAQGKLSTLPDALSTQADTAKAASGKAEIGKLYKYAAAYDPGMTNAEKRAVIDDMKRDGITKIRNRSLDEIADDPDRIDEAMSNIKKMAENTPEFEQKMAIKKQEGDNAYARGVGAAEVRTQGMLTKAEWDNASREKRTQMNLQAKAEVEQARQAAMSGRLNMMQYKARMLDRWEAGDEYAGQVLGWISKMELAKPASQAANANPHMTKDGQLAAPVVPDVPPLPTPPKGGAAPKDANAPTLSPDKKSVMVGGKKYEAYEDGKGSYAYQNDDGEWVIFKK